MRQFATLESDGVMVALIRTLSLPATDCFFIGDSIEMYGESNSFSLHENTSMKHNAAKAANF